MTHVMNVLMIYSRAYLKNIDAVTVVSVMYTISPRIKEYNLPNFKGA